LLDSLLQERTIPEHVLRGAIYVINYFNPY